MSTHRYLLLTALALVGCAETCPPPQSAFDQESFDVFGRVTSLDQEPAPEWPSESLPFNGPHTWKIEWTTNSPSSAVSVVIDDQVFEGEGAYDDVECGNFAIAFKGTWLADDGAEHAFAATADLVQWPEGIDGFVGFKSSWKAADGVTGSADGTAQLATTSGPGDATTP